MASKTKRVVVLVSRRRTYAHHIVAGLGADLLSLPDSTQASGATLADLSGNNHTVGVTGISLAHAGGPDSVPTLFFDGINDFGNWYTASLAGSIDYTEFTIFGWFRVANAGVWTDGVNRRVLEFNVAGGDNLINITKTASNNRFDFTYKAGGGGTKVIDHTSYNPTTWQAFALSVSLSAGATGEMKAYLGELGSPIAQVGATVENLDTWAGTPIDGRINYGAFSLEPLFVWHGWLAYLCIVDAILPLTTLQELML